MFRFKGIKIKACTKDKEENQFAGKTIEKFPLSLVSKVFIPLIQHIGAPCMPVVEKQEKVNIGQQIGASDKFISSSIHSSISGIVENIKDIPHPKLKSVKGIVIVNDNKNTMDKSILDIPEDINVISSKKIISRIKSAGIVGMGGAGFPTNVKLMPPEGKKINNYILNAAECEPYLNADMSLMKEKAKFVILGMKLAMKSVEVNKGYVGIEKSNKKIVEIIKKAIKETKDKITAVDIEIKMLPDSYPQGAEKQIIKTILRKEVPPESLPYDVGVIVNNVGTCFAIYEAVSLKKPLYERVITIVIDDGKIIRNFLVPIGIQIGDIIKYLNMQKGNSIKKIISGGPMMGDTQYEFETPIIKGTSGVVLFTGGTVENFLRQETDCIKCGKCINVCSVNLIPQRIVRLVKNERWDELDCFNIKDCVECGCCAYICPSNIPMVHFIRLGKSFMNNE